MRLLKEMVTTTPRWLRLGEYGKEWPTVVPPSDVNANTNAHGPVVESRRENHRQTGCRPCVPCTLMKCALALARRHGK